MQKANVQRMYHTSPKQTLLRTAQQAEMLQHRLCMGLCDPLLLLTRTTVIFVKSSGHCECEYSLNSESRQLLCANAECMGLSVSLSC